MGTFFCFCGAGSISLDFRALAMVNRAKAMEVDGVKRQGKHNKQVVGKGVASGKAAKKEDKMNARKEKKMLAKMIRNKKTAAEFSNHKPKASKNTEEKLAKNCYGRS